ncbi:LacI family DNA-binding transcriptional regulator [Clostridium paridis]|uniref:LacI family DNA-binding transcriptional regulator n=1 Tax=Clostridium paridis TaxID=2803863 RepID=A0A937FH49_9CLOT|nr:LacI family DNA-binding transcriptional regulator [Clostridium paridis]MBL4933289.1 LacI family DNA-binding transcriptional regulator [Clostridium paridis]
MITIYDIAKISGYSVSTVSRALNNQPRISKETRDKILEIVSKYDYIPNSKAVSLSIGKSFNLGIIVPYSSSNSYYDTIISGIMEEGFRDGYKVTFLPTNYDKEIELDYLKMFSSKEFDGLIILSASNCFKLIEEYKKYGPIICCEDVGDCNLPSVYINRFEVYEPILVELKKKNYKNFALTFSRTYDSSLASQKVFNIFQTNLKSFSTKLIYNNCKNFEDGYCAGKYFYSLKNNVDCIFANSDEVAAGIYKFFKDNNIKVPLIIGQDNQAISKLLDISTIDFHITTLGKKAVSMCISGEFRNEIIRSSFIKRGDL